MTSSLTESIEVFHGTEINKLQYESFAPSLSGRVLRNGAVVVDARVHRLGYFVVLAVRTDGAYDRFATWACSPVDGACFTGEYFHDLDEAVLDFEGR